MAFANKHVLITGGSEGLGLAIAKQLASQNARVSLIARTLTKLEAAEQAVLASYPQQQQQQRQQQQQQQQPSNNEQQEQLVYYHSADVTKYKQVVDAVQAAEAALGPVDVLICCAGMAECGYFHDCEPELYERQMSLNYMGSLHAAKAVYDGMLSRNAGHICFVASTMALMGLIGFSAYAPSKFAVRGLAECLRNELQGSKVAVSIAYPADINTPGYAKENLNKPWETAKVSEGVRLQSPDTVAARLLRGVARGEFLLPNSSFLVGLLQSITAGLIPRRLASLAWQALLGLASPLICSMVAAEHDGVARQGAGRRFARLWAAGQAAGQGAPPSSD